MNSSLPALDNPCQGCPYQNDNTQVPYSGKKTSKIVLVGEAPASEEVKVRQPFVGRSGQLLNKLLESIGLQRQEVIIANSVRCLINSAETKKVKEGLKRCRVYLSELIMKVKPQVVVCLGAIALQQVLKEKQILKQRGRFFWSEEFGCDVFVTVHPAFTLRVASKGFPNIPIDVMSPKERYILDDFFTLKEYLESGKKPELVTDNYVEVDNFLMVKGKTISVDFETSSANYHDSNCRVLSVSISDESGKAYTHVFKMKGKRYIIPKGFKELMGTGYKKVVTARPFDENVCRYLLGIDMKGEIYDTLTMAHVLDENSFPVYNLENIAGYYGGMQRIKDVAEGYRENLAEAPREVLVKYNSVDADATIRAYQTMIGKYQGDDKLFKYLQHFIQPVQEMLSDISKHGVLVDQALLDTNERIVQEKVDELVEESKRLLPRGMYKEVAEGYSLTKNAMLQQVLFTHPKGFKKKPEMVTPKTHAPQVNEAHLKMFSNIPFVSKVLEWRKHYKILTTYFPMVRDSLKSDGRVYPNVSLVRTATGRSVTLDPGITIIPARGELAKLIKDVFVADRGWVFGARDLSQSEIRIMGWIAGDRNILGAIEKGIDIHTKTASVVNGVPIEKVTKEMRQQAKGINFGFLYGMIAKTFKQYAKESYGLDLSLEECERIRTAFFAKPHGYYALPEYYRRVEKILKEYGYIRSPLGRKRRLPAIFSDNFAERSEALRQGINFVIQSFSSDLAFIGMMLFWREYSKSKALKDKVKALWFIHDSIIFTAKEEVFDDAMAILKECMEEKSKVYIKDKFGLTIGYKIESDAKKGERWGSLQNYS